MPGRNTNGTSRLVMDKKPEQSRVVGSLFNLQIFASSSVVLNTYVLWFSWLFFYFS